MYRKITKVSRWPRPWRYLSLMINFQIPCLGLMTGFLGLVTYVPMPSMQLVPDCQLVNVAAVAALRMLSFFDF